jgi:hypothetical protein
MASELFDEIKTAMQKPAGVYPENFNKGVYNKFSFDGKTYTLIKHDRYDIFGTSFYGAVIMKKTESSVEVQIKNNNDGKVATYEFTGLQNILLRWYYLRCIGKRL